MHSRHEKALTEACSQRFAAQVGTKSNQYAFSEWSGMHVKRAPRMHRGPCVSALRGHALLLTTRFLCCYLQYNVRSAVPRFLSSLPLTDNRFANGYEGSRASI